jgi:MFS family permease
MISLLMFGSIINYLTRSTLGVAAPTILQDLHITTEQYSWIVGAFQGAIMLQPICGYALDVIGLRVGFALFAIAWSLISMAHSLAYTWPALAVLRGLLGFAEGCANPAGMKATAEWFPARERGLAGGLFNIGARSADARAAARGLGDPHATGGSLSSSPASSVSCGRRCGWPSTTRRIGTHGCPPPSATTSSPARSSTSEATAAGPRSGASSASGTSGDRDPALRRPDVGTLTFWLPS